MVLRMVMRIVAWCVGVVGQLVGEAGQEDPIVGIVDANASAEEPYARKICC